MEQLWSNFWLYLTNETSLETSSISNNTMKKDPLQNLTCCHRTLLKELQEQRKKLIPKKKNIAGRLSILFFHWRWKSESRVNWTIPPFQLYHCNLQCIRDFAKLSFWGSLLVVCYPIFQHWFDLAEKIKHFCFLYLHHVPTVMENPGKFLKSSFSWKVMKKLKNVKNVESHGKSC